MRIIQTFWSGGHNPLECGYGVVDVQTKGIRLLQERPMTYGELEEMFMEGFSLKSEESRE